MTLTSVFLALTTDASIRQIVENPTPLQAQGADSVHVLAFTSQGDLLVAESEGSFTMNEWEAVHDAAKAICCDGSEDMDMQDGEAPKGSMMMFVRSAMEDKVKTDLQWKD